MAIKKRETWIDAVKVFACILVAAGHFFQSMVSAGVLSENALYKWFDQSIYTFHVPLFFICSGYLYQKNECIDTVSAWKKNVMKKALTLGVPYVAFSFATWMLKVLFPGAVNDQVDGLFKTLFCAPIHQYWYLYCLFLLFAITPTFRNAKKCYFGFAVALILKLLSWLWNGEIQAVSYILNNEIWFVAGMCICSMNMMNKVQSKHAFCAGILAAVFFIVYGVFRSSSWENLEIFVLGLIACFASLTIIGSMASRSSGHEKYINMLSQYTMPVFLMHTIFAAAFRTLLFKVGIDGAVVHFAVGLFVSFGGPIIAWEIMKKIKYLDFLLLPGKYIRL